MVLCDSKTREKYFLTPPPHTKKTQGHERSRLAVENTQCADLLSTIANTVCVFTARWRCIYTTKCLPIPATRDLDIP